VSRVVDPRDGQAPQHAAQAEFRFDGAVLAVRRWHIWELKRCRRAIIDSADLFQRDRAMRRAQVTSPGGTAQLSGNTELRGEPPEIDSVHVAAILEHPHHVISGGVDLCGQNQNAHLYSASCI
jgi:hypothetical protein